MFIYRVTVDSLYIYDQSFLDCNTIMFAEDVCKFSSKNKTVDINMKSVTVIYNIYYQIIIISLMNRNEKSRRVDILSLGTQMSFI